MPQPTITYPLDLTGVSSANLVQGELHATNESILVDNNFIVPNFTPFYIDNFRCTVTIGNVTRELVEDVDFEFALAYVTGTRVTGKAMYAGITIHNVAINGILSMNYQTVGGDQVADRLAFLALLADKAYNPKTTIYDLLVNTPTSFPPTPAYSDYNTYYGQDQLVQVLGEIRDAIIQNSSLTSDQLAAFLSTINSGVMATYIKKTGDTMTGRLILAGNPVEDLEAVTKKYLMDNMVDSSQLSSFMSQYYTATYMDQVLAAKVTKSGDAMTGFLTLNAPPEQDMHAVNKATLDTTIANLQHQVDVLTTTLSNLSLGHVTQGYVDDAVSRVMAYIETSHWHRGA
jgi:hypothetical protein